MRLSAAIALLCAALWHGVALAAADAADAPVGQDPDLELIPKAVQPSGTPVAPRPADTGGRMYLENAFSVSSLRSGLLVPAPAPLPYDWQERLFLDVRKEIGRASCRERVLELV